MGLAFGTPLVVEVMQDPDKPQVRVRGDEEVTYIDDRQEIKGGFHRADAGTLTIKSDAIDALIRIPRETVLSVDVVEEPRTRDSALVPGGLVGAAAGLGAAALLGVFTEGDLNLLGTVLYGGAFGGGGALIGALSDYVYPETVRRNVYRRASQGPAVPSSR